ncbi:DNA polymerase III subunit beta, partial [Bacteriovoracaceae bacterium]|nr:DNA polymerase III subunit beta [Bacteriovoracaceae bacterium]
ITYKENSLEIIATDLEVSLKIYLQAKTEGEGDFCISTKQLFEVVKELPNSELSLSIDQNSNQVHLDCENVHFTLLVIGTSEFPRIDFMAHSTEFELAKSEIKKIIQKCSFAISSDETRVNLNGIYLQKFNQNTLRSVAIDGHRLAMIDLSRNDVENQALHGGCIVPKKGISELARLSDSLDENMLKVSLDESNICFRVPDKYHLAIQLIAREYPKYSAVIPPKTAYNFVVDREALLSAVKRVKILANEKNNGIKFHLQSSTCLLSTSHPTHGEAKEDISINYEGDDIEIGFNAKYLIDNLSVLNDGKVTFEFNNELSPVIVKGQEDPEFLGIIMPLKL